MPKLWQFPAHVQTFQALPQPIAPGAGFESCAPVLLPKKKAAQTGQAEAYQLNPAATVAVPLGFPTVAPDRVRTTKWVPGADFWPPLRKLPTVNDFPMGFEPLFPPKLLKAKMPGTFEDHALNKPPAATAHDPLGWEPTFPWKLPRRPVDRGTAANERQPPPTTAANPIGWRVDFPDRLRKRPTDAAGYVQALLALAQPVAPNGWAAQFPWKLLKRPTDTGSGVQPGNQPPAATSQFPLGWEPLFPWRVRSGRAPGIFDHLPLFLVPAATSANPLGWEATAPWWLKKRPTDAGVVNFALIQPRAATAQNPIGWRGEFPDRMRGRFWTPGAGECPTDRPPPTVAANPLGWEGIFPWRLPKKANDGTFQLQFRFGALTPMMAWYSFPDRMPRVYQRAIAVETVLLAPARFPEGWPPVYPGRFCPRIVDRTWTSNLLVPAAPPLFAWHQFPDRMKRRRADLGTAFSPVDRKAGIVLGDGCIFPVTFRKLRLLPAQFVEVWLAIMNPTIAARRIEFREPARKRIEVAGIINRRRESTEPIVRRQEPA